MCYPTEKANEETEISRAGLNSSEAINVLTSQDCLTCHFTGLRLTPLLFTQNQKKRGGRYIKTTFKLRLEFLQVYRH